MGLMALQPATAKRFGVTDPFDPQNNIDGGTRLILELLMQFQGNIALTVAGYNAGDIAVRKYNGVPPYRETTDYVKYVSRIYDACKRQGE
jgi:soluble lytic murein transglycosylase-like protein